MEVLEAGHEMEVEIRCVSLYATELLVEEINKISDLKINSVIIGSDPKFTMIVLKTDFIRFEV